MSSRIKEFVRDAAGATAVEYSLIAALFVMGTIAGMHALGSPLQNMILVVLNVVNYVIGYVTA